ncbi:MAG TPA: hypothetical protein VF551_00525 [Chthoniobacterales bacterium]|jgi:hypothetical protein
MVTAAGDLHAQVPSPSASKPIFQPRPFGPVPPAKETPPRPMDVDDEKPIPRGWIIGGVAAAVLAAAALLYGASRAWRSSNLFDRQYRFPADGDVALRFGGQKSGGHMATTRFEENRTPGKERSKSKKT